MDTKRLISIFRVMVFLAVISVSISGQSQESLLTTTLNDAKDLRNQGDFEAAALLLSDFSSLYPGNAWILRLYAETLFWMQKYDEAALAYEEAISWNPNDLEAKYEYAILLFEMGNYMAAKELLDEYTTNIADVAGAESLLGITNYYLGDFKESEKHLEKAIELNQNDYRTRQFYSLVSSIVKPWLKAGLSYSQDSQPLKNWMPKIQGGWYGSPLLNLSFTLDLQSFSTDSIHSDFFSLQLNNRFQFQKTGFSASVSAGGFYTAIDHQFDYTWGIGLQQKIADYLLINLAGERSAYTYTVSSIESPFTRNKYSLSLAWKKPKKWNASSAYIFEYFPDKNFVQTFYIWGLSPSISFSIFEIYFGYAFNYADAKESRYAPELTANEIEDVDNIKGIYNPYFTPEDQFSNSIMTNFYIQPSEKMSIKLHASVGFYARAMNPYFYLDTNNSGEIIFVQDFYQESFTPLDLGFSMNSNLSDKLILDFSYQYLQTFYFDSHNFLLGLKIYF